MKDSVLRFLLDGTTVASFHVRDTAPPDSATRLYSVIADHGWAERILCSGCYLRDAVAIADTIGEAIGVPVHKPDDPLARRRDDDGGRIAPGGQG